MEAGKGNGQGITSAKTPSGEPDYSLRISIWDGACAVLHGVLTGGALVPAYALMLGANDFHLGLLAAFPALSSAGCLVSSRLIPRFGHRKLLTITSGVGGRLLCSLLCTLPFLPLLPGWRLTAFIGVIFLGSFLMNISGNSWTSWMTDLVPAERRGRYFSFRNAICGTVSMISLFGVGKLYDFLEPQVGLPMLFFMFYGISIIFAVLTGFLLRRQWEPPLQEEKPISLRETISIPWFNPDFRRLLLFASSFTMACSLSSPFFQPHMLKNLNMQMTWIAVYGLIFQITALCTLPFWGRLTDRIGNRPILIFTSVLLSCLLIPWLIVTPDRIWVLWLDASLSGICWPGFNLAAFNILLNTAPKQNRSSYLAMHSMMTGFLSFIGSVLGGLLAQALATFSWVVGAMHFNNFHLLFAITLLARFSSVPLAIRLKEEKSHSVSMMINYAASGFVGWMNATLQTGITVIRKITRK